MARIMSEPLPWVMPDWMEKYREYFYNTGGNSIENLMNDTTDTTLKTPVHFAMVASVLSQVNLMYRLHQEGKL